MKSITGEKPIATVWLGILIPEDKLSLKWYIYYKHKIRIQKYTVYSYLHKLGEVQIFNCV